MIAALTQRAKSQVLAVWPPSVLHWLFRIGRVVQAELAWPLPVYILLFILSKITLLLALLLPWNILATLSLGQSSLRLEMIFGQLASGVVVAILMALVLVCFGVHLAAEALGAEMCERASATILDRHSKLGLSESLRSNAASDYRRILRLFAMLAYSTIAVVLIGIGYPTLLIILVGYVILGALVVAMLPPASPQGVSSELRGRAWWGTGFICLVGWVIHDAWRGTMPSFWSVFFSLLLARQTLIFLMMSASTLGVLWRRRERVEALFVADRPFMTQSRQEAGLTELLTEDRRDAWLSPLLAEMSPERLSLDLAATQWTEQGRVAYLVARPENSGDDHSLMIRLFHRSVVGMGHHEAELLAHGTQNWPAPTLIGKRDVAGNLALIFRCWGECEWAPPMMNRNDTLALRGQILGCEVPDDLAMRYLRSRSRLPDRATAINWPMFSGMARTASEVADCTRLEAAWPQLMQWLRHRPSQIVLPKMAARRMARGSNGGRLICNWTLWQWEPLGFDWPWCERPEQDLRQCLDVAAQLRPSLADCLVEDVLLVAVVASFTDRSETGAFSAMLDLLLPLVNAVERCGLLYVDAREHAGDAYAHGPTRPLAQEEGK